MADDEENPLVRALFQGRSLAVIRWIVEDTPRWLRHRDDQGRLPIHRIFEMDPLPSPKVVRYLIRQFPDSVRKWTSTGSLPIHLACDYASFLRYTFPSWYDDFDVYVELSRLSKIARTLVRHWPDSVRERNARGELPLHLFCTDIRVFHDDMVSVMATIRFLIQVGPETLMEKITRDEYLCTALSLFVGNSVRM
jgi:hypothetical protein